jgi:hypothetical protein
MDEVMGRTKIMHGGATYVSNSPDGTYNISNFSIFLVLYAGVSDFSNYKPYLVLVRPGRELRIMFFALVHPPISLSRYLPFFSLARSLD